MASSEEDGGGNGAVGEKGKKRKLGALATAWLIFYNVAMTAGWLVLGIAMVRFYIQKGTHRGLFRSVQKTLKFFQTFALLEVVHCAVGELLTIYAALPYVKKTGMFSLRLPNKYNVSFDYYYFLIIVMFSYVPLFPQLYFHMLRQRRRVLHGEVIVEKDD